MIEIKDNAQETLLITITLSGTNYSYDLVSIVFLEQSPPCFLQTEKPGKAKIFLLSFISFHLFTTYTVIIQRERNHAQICFLRLQF